MKSLSDVPMKSRCPHCKGTGLVDDVASQMADVLDKRKDMVAGVRKGWTPTYDLSKEAQARGRMAGHWPSIPSDVVRR